MKEFNSKRKNNKFLIILISILALVVLAQFTLFKDNRINLKEETAKVEENTQIRDNTVNNTGNQVIIDFGDGRQIKQNINAQTPYKALEVVADSQGYKINSKQYKYGLIVEEINRVRNTPDKSWIYSVNGQPGRIAADRYILKSNDVVEWKYSGVK